jgi:DNA-binding response OmpR family regulator
VQTRSVDMAVARLRKKLRDDSDPPRLLLTVRGKGYRLTL